MIRAGITFDNSIINCNSDFDCPKYDIYYIHQELDAYYNLKNNWTNSLKRFSRKLQQGDYMIIIMKKGKMIYKINDEQLEVVLNIPEHEKNEIYLLVHDRKCNCKCNIEYITELLD